MRLPNPDESRVVLIGTSEYASADLPDLAPVSASVLALERTLTDPVHGLVPAGHCCRMLDEGDLRLVGDRLEKAADAARDLLIVYYSGHGVVGGRRHELFLGLRDSEPLKPTFNSLEYVKLRDAVLGSPARTKVIVLDCCFSGLAFSGTMASAVDAALGQTEVDGTYVLAATARDKPALICQGEEYTAFSGRLLTILWNGIPGGPELLSVDHVYRELLRVMLAEGLPRPHARGSDLAGQLALAANRAYQSRDAGDLNDRLGAVRELGRLLLGADATLAVSAYQLLRGLADDTSREVAEAADLALCDAPDTVTAAGQDAGQPARDGQQNQWAPMPAGVASSMMPEELVTALYPSPQQQAPAEAVPGLGPSSVPGLASSSVPGLTPVRIPVIRGDSAATPRHRVLRPRPQLSREPRRHAALTRGGPTERLEALEARIARLTPAKPASRYDVELPGAVMTAFFASAKTPIARAEPLYKDVADESKTSWKLLAAIDWMECQADPRRSPVHGERLGTRNDDGTSYATKSAALAQSADNLIALAAAVYGIDLTIRRPLSVRELAAAFAAFHWGGLLKSHGVSPMEFPYSVAGLTLAHAKMSWPAIDGGPAPDRPGSRFRKPFGAVPVMLMLAYPATV